MKSYEVCGCDFRSKLDVQKHISCLKTERPDKTVFFTPTPPTLSSFLPSLPPLPPCLFFLNGMKVAMAGVQDHHA